ncbi:aldo/keto reductase [Candidatus Stoquefichus massiliensis]|uniref:aldo/keto reductase n=1 Tax=Candidatus Stoquefichus massiliensis TaxID=1470350 RepID=UPI0004851765|nr:aldo/keto reductase [Candidatus Stoquefichus massiliensis]
MEYIKLNNGIIIPQIGFGVCGFTDLKACEDIVLKAVESGYRLFDTAAIYGNEEAIGNAILKSGIPRNEFFITSKLWVTDNSYEKAKKGFDESLEKLQLDYIDLYLIHRPLGDYYGAWKALTELYKEGKIKAIGVSNFFDDRLYDLIYNTEVKPAVNQIQCHPFMQREDERKLYQEWDVQLQAWSPFASGMNHLFDNELLKELSYQYRKSVGQIILRWHIQRGIVVIPQSHDDKRMKENINIFDFTLSDEDMNRIAALDVKKVEDTSYRLESLKRVYKI